MVIVETVDKSGNKGPRLLVDLRNDLIFIWSSDDTWDKVPLKSPINGLQLGQPLNVTDIFGQLDGLVVRGNPQHYRGPHPEGRVRCLCGGFTDTSGFCPRCHDDRCHVCGRSLTITKVKSGEGLPHRELKLCIDPTHNPLPIPHWRTEPMKGEELPTRKPKEWPKRITNLPTGIKKIVNNFFNNLMGIDRLDLLNWQDECKIHSLPKMLHDFKELKGYYKDSGLLK